MFDSHAHLADPAFDLDRADVVERARQAGVHGITCIGESLDAARRSRAVAEGYQGFVWWTAGVHPHDAHAFDEARDGAAIRECLHAGAVAVGECGLDYHYDHSPRTQQREAFFTQLAIAAEHKRPVVMHSRLAEADTLAMIEEASDSGVIGIAHCFSGSREMAERVIAAGWFVSFSGIITFKKWSDDEVIRCVPLDRVLVETDAPYLAPVPHRGKRNEPALISLTVAKLAATYACSIDDMANTVTANARAVFGLATAETLP